MNKQNSTKVASSKLRRKAEELLKSKTVTSPSPFFETADTKLIRELELHQIELALQNEELMLSQSEVKLASEKYIDLYDSVPTGYFTLSINGDILEVNFSGAAMLGKERPLLLNNEFQEFLTGDTKPIFLRFVAKVFKTRVKQSCEVSISTYGNELIYAYLTAVADENGRNCHVTAVDITETRLQNKINLARLHLLQFAENHTMDELLEETINKAEEVTGSMIGFYHFVEADQKTLYLQNWSTRTKKDFRLAKGKGSHYEIELAGVWADCVRERRPVIHNDYSSLPNKKGMPSGHALVVRELVVPVLRGRKLVAILGVGNKPFLYNKKDIELVSSLADLAWDASGRKKAEEALQVERRNFSAVFESSPVAMLVIDQTTNIVMANLAAIALGGGSASDFLQHRPGNAFRCLHSFKDPRGCGYSSDCRLCELRNGIEGLIASGGELNRAEVELTLFRNKEPRKAWLRIGVEPLLYNGSRHWCLAIDDITEQKKSQTGIKLNEEKFRGIFTQASVGTAIVNMEKRFLSCNPAFCNFLGYEEEELIGKSISDITLPEDIVQDMLEIDQIVNKEIESITLEKRCIRKDSTLVWAEVSISLVCDEKGNPLFLLPIIQDITARKQAQQELQKSEERYRSLLTNLNAGVVVHAPDTSIIMSNSKASELLGLSDDQMLGRMAIDPDWKFVNKNKVQLPLEEYPVNQVAATRMPFGNEILGVIRPPANDLLWLTVNGFPVLDSHGKIVEILISFFEITESIKAHEALRLKNLVFDASIAANSIADLNGNITEANNAFLKLWGYPYKEEVLGKPILHFLNNTNEAAAIATALNEKCEWEGDYTAKRKDGSTFIAHSVATSLKDINGNIIGFQSAVIDITQRKLSEEALRESEQKFRDTVTFLDEGYYSVTIDGVLLEHNQAFNQLMGFDKSAELRGTLLPDFWLFPDERKEYLQQLLTNGSISNYQTKAKKKTGEIISVLLSSHLVSDSENHPLKIEGIFIDITERIRIEESLQRLTMRLQNLHQIDQAILKATESPETIVQTALQHILEMLECKSTSVGIFDFDRKEVKVFAAAVDSETIVEVDRILTEDLYGDLEILHQNKMEIVEDFSLIKSPSPITKVLIDEGIRSSVNVALVSGKGLYGALNIGWDSPRFFSKDDQEIAAEVAAEISIAIEQARLLNDTRRYAYELEVKVLERTTQLEESNKELEAFSYSVSHDLRAPLRHLSGFAELLTNCLRNTLPEKEKHYLDVITDSAHQMGLLIDDLLQFSRTGRMDMQLTEVDMKIVLQDALQTIKHDAAGRDISWNVALLPKVYGDFALLRLVWLNLLGNAVKFTSSRLHTRIEIGVTPEKSEFVFFVRDNGVGFDMQYANKLFGVFQRLHSFQEFEGTGIGLANVRRIILRHGGRTWADAKLNKGATFYFSLPIQKEKNND